MTYRSLLLFIDSQRLDSSAKVLLLHLVAACVRKGAGTREVAASYDQLGKAIPMSNETVSRAAELLENEGLVAIDRIPRQPNVYGLPGHWFALLDFPEDRSLSVQGAPKESSSATFRGDGYGPYEALR